ncbi:reverse transcriptase domain-containing protein [Tanacetum coccineum]
MPPKRTTTPMTDAVIKALIAQGVATALAEYEANRGVEMAMIAMIMKVAEGQSALLWFEKMESVFHTISHEVAYGITWKTLKKMMTDKYCPRTEIKKLEIKLWNLKVKGTDVVSYNQRFQELALMCGRMSLDEFDEVEKYVGGLPDMIQGSVMVSKPKTMQDTIEIANDLMDHKIRTFSERQAENKSVSLKIFSRTMEVRSLY